MNKRTSQKKIKGEIIMMQNDLMSKLAAIEQPSKQLDDLGFGRYAPKETPDALVSLISRSKEVTKGFSKEIEAAKQVQKRESRKRKRESDGTFLTGLGLTKQNEQVYRSKQEIPTLSKPSTPEPQEATDPDEMLKEMILKNQRGDDLSELRKLIKETGTNLQGCSRKLNKSKKSIMSIADRYTSDLSFGTYHLLQNYKEFEVKNLEDV